MQPHDHAIGEDEHTAEADPALDVEDLVEDVSIDGMCGVY